MTETQWRKLQLRLRSLLRHRKLVNLLIWEDVDGSLHIQLVDGKTETISGADWGTDWEPPRRTSF